MIEVNGLTKNYGDRTALDHLTFRLEKGEVLGFLGPNGAGKTTTMRILTGYMPASEGRAVVAGHDIFAHPREVKSRIGYLPEMPPLYPEMTVGSYLRYVAALKGVPPRRVRAAADRALDRCTLGDVRRRLIRHLSKGYRQRVGLAQAIINDPEVLIMDEPTSGLDPQQVIEIRNLVAELSREQTIVLSTHILPEVMAICSRVLIIHRGRKVADEPLEQLTKGSQGMRAYRLVVGGGETSYADALRNLEGVRSVKGPRRLEGAMEWRLVTRAGPETPARMARLVVERGLPLIEMASEGTSLEDVFIRLITESEQAT